MLVLSTFQSCIQYTDLLLMSPEMTKSTFKKAPLHRLKKYDVVHIELLNKPLPTPNRFEKMAHGNLGPDKMSQLIQLGYPVDEEGYIAYPGISKTFVEGLTLKEAAEKLAYKLAKFIDQPNLVLHLMNFQITVLGEVNQPGRYYFDNPRVTVLDAVAKAGDFSSFADRRQLLIKREIQDSTFHLPISLHQVDQVYLVQNDAIYVPPLKQKAIVSQDPFQKIIGYLSAFLSLISVWIALNN